MTTASRTTRTRDVSQDVPPNAPPGPFRYEPGPGDVAAVRDIVASSGFFNPEEAAIATELVEDRLTKGEASDYRLVFLEQDGHTVGYTCYGHIAGTLSSYDLYWIAVHEQRRRRGAGALLLQHTEELIARAGGDGIYVETSSRPQYEPTRSFYDKHGYQRVAALPDFYGPGDGKVIYVKRVAGR